MNSDPNSDCKQFTKSKLGRVHSVHTLNPGYVHTAPRSRAGRRVLAPSGRALAHRVATSGHAVSQLPPPPPPPPPPPRRDTKFVSRYKTLCRARELAVSQLRVARARAVLHAHALYYTRTRCIAALLLAVLRPKGFPPCHDTKIVS